MRPRVWTYNEVRRLTELWHDGAPITIMAREFGCHVDTVARKAAKLGLERDSYRHLRVPTHAHPLVRRLFNECSAQGISSYELGHRSGLPSATIRGWSASMPRVDSLEAALNSIGYEIQLVRAKKPVDRRVPSLKRLMDHASEITGVPVADIRMSSRARHVSAARHVFFWLACEYGDASLAQIAQFAGLSDSTSVAYGRQKVAAMIDSGEIERPAPPPAPKSGATMRPVALAMEAAE